MSVMNIISNLPPFSRNTHLEHLTEIEIYLANAKTQTKKLRKRVLPLKDKCIVFHIQANIYLNNSPHLSHLLSRLSMF